MDYKSKTGATRDPTLYADLKMDGRPINAVEVSLHGNKMFVTVNSKENKSAGDGRITGDMHIMVNGPALIYVPKISNAK